MRQGTLLIVDDNRSILTTVKMAVQDTFEKVVAIASPANIPARLREDRPDVVLLDMNFRSGINNGNEGLYWLREIRRMRPQAQVVLFTAYADIDLAVTGMREGAADFIVKPFNNGRLVETLAHAYQRNHRPSSSKGKEGRGGDAPVMLWGDTPAMRDLRIAVEKVAPTDANVLITGENGTGKEVLAREIHRLSGRSGGPLAIVDMGAVTATLFESELFGYVKGAFTDAKADHPGKMETAEGGTLFLDEIGNLDYGLQAKLLTALQRRTIVRVGGSKEIAIDVRLVSATNKDLEKMVADGTFREDLLYRINTIRLHLPPLRDRKDDIVPLARHFLGRYAALYNKPGMAFTPAAEAKMARLPWYGNIRELQHSIEKAVILSDGMAIGADDIDAAGPRTEAAPAAQTLDGMERQLIAKTITGCHGNLSQVASRLGISRQTLYNKIKRYGL